MEASVPVTLKYKIFGSKFDSKGKFTLRSSPDSRVWTMPFWGVTGASQVGEEVTLKDNTITLDGVATTSDVTVVALTTSSPQTTAAAIGENSEYAHCTQSPRCSIRFRELEVPTHLPWYLLWHHRCSSFSTRV